MSSAPTTANSTPANADALAGSHDQVRQSLHAHLRKTAQFIRILDTLVVMFAWVTALLGLWLVACIVDHWLVPLPGFGRWLIWGAAVAGSAWWIGKNLVPLAIQRISPVYAARRIESLVPEFKNGLISWLELERMPEHGVPRGVMAALTYRAAKFIGGQDPSSTVDTNPLIKLVGLTLLLCTSLVVYTMISPKSALVTGERIAFPWRTVAAPTRVKILEVLPGSVELTQGAPLKVEAQLRGLFANDTVIVRFNALDGQLSDQRQELTSSPGGTLFAGIVTTDGRGVEQEIEYWIEAGDARSRPYRITISPLPTIAIESLRLEYPSYTKLEPREVAVGGQLEAVEGTRATIKARANQALKKGRLELNPQLNEQGELRSAANILDMQVDGRSLQAEMLLLLNDKNENPSSLNFRIRGYNARGDANANPIVNRIEVFADVAPEVDLLGPESRILRVSPTARINLEIRATDPDFGLSSISATVKNRNLLLREASLLKDQSVTGRQVKTLQVDLATLKANVGDKIFVVAYAEDNRHDPRTGKLAANRSLSEPLMLEVVAIEQADTPEKFLAPDEQNSPPKNNDQQNDEQSNADSTAQPNTGGAEQPSNSGGTDSASAGQNKPNQQNTGDQKSGEPSAAEAPNGQQQDGQQQDGQQQSANAGQSGKASENSGKSGGQPDSSQQQGSPKQGEQGSSGQSTGKGSQGGGNQQSSGSESGGEQSSDSAGQGSQGASGEGGNQQSGNQQSSSQQASSQQTGNQSATGQNSSGANSSSPSNNSRPGSNGAGGKPSGDSAGGQAPNDGAANNSGSQAGSQSANQNAPANDGAGGKSSSGSPAEQPARDRRTIEKVRDYMESKQGDNQQPNGQQPNGQQAGSQPTDNQQPSGNQQASGDQQAKPGSEAGSNAEQGQGNNETGNKPAGSNDQGKPSSGGDSANQQAGNTKNQAGDTKNQAGDTKNQAGENAAKNEGSGGKQTDDPSSKSSTEDASQSSNGGQSGSQNTSQNKAGSQNKSGSQNGGGSKAEPGAKQDKSGSQSGSGEQADSGSQAGQSGQSGSQEGSSAGDQKGAGTEQGSKDSNAQEGKSQGAGSQGGESGGESGGQSAGKQDSGKQDSGAGSAGGSDQSKQPTAPEGAAGKEQQAGNEQSGSEQQAGGQQAGKQQQGGQEKGAQQQGSQQQGSQQQESNQQAGQQQAGQQQAGQQQGSQQGSQQAGQQQGRGNAARSDSPNPGNNQAQGGGDSGRGGEGGSDGLAMEPNESYAKKATELVLDYLNRQKDQPDPELMRELEWNKGDFDNFLDRWNKARDLASSPDPDQRRRWEEQLNALGLQPPRRDAISGSGLNDSFRQQLDAGSRVRPPERLRKQYEAFQKALQQRGS